MQKFRPVNLDREKPTSHDKMMCRLQALPWTRATHVSEIYKRFREWKKDVTKSELVEVALIENTRWKSDYFVFTLCQFRQDRRELLCVNCFFFSVISCSEAVYLLKVTKRRTEIQCQKWWKLNQYEQYQFNENRNTGCVFGSVRFIFSSAHTRTGVQCTSIQNRRHCTTPLQYTTL